MDQLTDALRDLDPPAPPSAVDLDAVVRRARRHRTRVRTFVAATVAAMLAVAVAVPVAMDRSWNAAAPPRAVCTPVAGAAAVQPRSELEAQARGVTPQDRAARATTALDGPLRRALPGATLLDAATCRPEFAFRVEADRYGVEIVVVDGAGVADLAVWVGRGPASAASQCPTAVEVTSCLREEQDDGTVVVRARFERGGGAVLLTVDAYRPGGGHVHLYLRNFVAAGDGVRLTRPEPPLDDAALTALTRIEGLIPW